MATMDTGRASGGLYRAMWRWHFYAGLIVLPMMLWLAATGGLYLYKPEIEALVYGSWTRVEPRPGPVSIARLVAMVERETGSRVMQIGHPASPDSSWRMAIEAPGGARRIAFVDPYRARLLGTASGGGVMATVKDLHSLAITGPAGNALIEIVAGWAIVLAITGLFLWWPRRGSPVLGLRGPPRGRLFWRDLHASAGLLSAAVILFLATTGMPWTGVAGKQLDAWVKRSGAGRPERPAAGQGGAAPAGAHQAQDEHAGHDMSAASLPWSMQRLPPPPAGAGHVSPDQALAIVQWSGMPPAWTLTLPARPGAPYLFSAQIVRAEDAHVVYVDPASGRVLQDARYPEFGAAARWIEWGVAAHQGQQYGEANRLLMLFGCIAVWLLGVTAPILWWKRRTGGRLREPPRADRRRERLAAGAMLVLGLLLPLTGLTMAVALAGEALMRRLRPGRWRTGA